MLKLADKIKRYIFLIILFWCFVSRAEEGNIQWVKFAPLDEEISVSTVDITNADGWITCPTVEMRGRIQLVIQNTSSSHNLYLSGTSGSTAERYWTLHPYQIGYFKTSSDLHIYATSNSAITFQTWEIK